MCEKLHQQSLSPTPSVRLAPDSVGFEAASSANTIVGRIGFCHHPHQSRKGLSKTTHHPTGAGQPASLNRWTSVVLARSEASGAPMKSMAFTFDRIFNPIHFTHRNTPCVAMYYLYENKNLAFKGETFVWFEGFVFPLHQRVSRFRKHVAFCNNCLTLLHISIQSYP